MVATTALVRMPLALVGGLVLVGVGIFVVLCFLQPRWALMVELFLAFGYVIDALRQSAGIPVTTESVLLLVLVGVLFRRLFGIERPEVPVREALLLAGLMGAIFVSTAFAGDPARSLQDIAEFAEWGLLAFAIVYLLDSPVWLRRAAWTLVASATALAALASFQQLTGAQGEFFGFARLVQDVGFVRSAGPIDPNFFAQILVFCSLLAFYLGISAERRERALGLAACAVCLLGLVFTYSRGGLGAVAAAFLLAAVLRKVRPLIPLGGLAVAVVAGILLLPEGPKERLTAVVSPIRSGVQTTADGSIRGRFSENIAAVQMFVDHPLVGVGPENYPPNYTDYSKGIGLDPRGSERTPHSLYLEFLAETGLIGALVFFAVLWAALAGLWRARARLTGREALLVEGTLVALAGFLVTALFLHAAYQRNVWIPIGLALAAGRLARAPAGDEAGPAEQTQVAS